MAYTQAQLEALQEALGKGVLSVTFQGRTVVYRSTRDLQNAISTIENALKAQSGTRIRQYRFGSSKGL